MTEAHKRALVVAYFLSRCDKKGCKALGFHTWSEAFVGIGTALGVPPNSIKQMRESFDPFCSSVRVGWYQRPPLRSRVQVMESYADVSDAALYEIARDILLYGASVDSMYTAPLTVTETGDSVSIADNLAYAARLRTGEAAEEYFREQYPLLPRFFDMELEDTRRLGTGFDFRVHGMGITYAVEVKGITGPTGAIAFSDKEWTVAGYLKQNYILALVRSLSASPVLELTDNPATTLSVTKRSIETISVYWNASV